MVSERTIPVRKIVRPKRGADGLFIQPREIGPERERVEAHNRERFAVHHNYADPVAGNPRTYDPEGRYNCGRCNQVQGPLCLLLHAGDADDLQEREPLEVDPDAGSCEDWEIQCGGDFEMPLRTKAASMAAYGVAKNGKGFGCHRCPYSEPAFTPDSIGRDLYCKQGEFRNFGAACCDINGAETVGSIRRAAKMSEEEMSDLTRDDLRKMFGEG